MTFESLKEVIWARPFQPFTLRLADGRSRVVRHPEFVAFVADKRTLMWSQPGSGFELIDLILINSIEIAENPRRKGGGNGKKNGHR
jgi:hypothetical protein